MAKRLLMKLRGVPEDELTELYALLEDNGIDFYETSAGNWGMSLPALWLSDDSQYEHARALLDAYQRERFARVRGEYEELQRAGRARGWLDIIRENPARFILYMVGVAALVWISTVPFISLNSAR